MLQMIKLASYLLGMSRSVKMSRLSLVGVMVTGLASGLAMAALVAVINALITGEGPASTVMMWAFLALVVARPALRLVSQILLLRLTEHSFYALRVDLCRRILATPMRHLEELGRARLMAGLSTDVGQVASAMVLIPTLVMNAAVVIGFVAYLGWLSLPLLPLLFALTIIGWVTFKWAMQKAVDKIVVGRELYDKLFQGFRAVTEGTKELKMHSRRREVFLADLDKVSRDHRREIRHSDVALAWLGTWSEILFFVAIGFILFAAPYFITVSHSVLSAYVLTVLMLRTPMEALNNGLPTLAQSAIAIKKIGDLTQDLGSRGADVAPAEVVRPGAAWRELEMIGVTHTYRREADDEHFVMGPIDLAFQPGELVFIVGGNGSGKTTLAKILLGIYGPEGGEIRLDGEVIDEAGRDRYRQHFSAVFSDFFLFESLMGMDSPDLDRAAGEYLEKLHLQHKVKVANGELSTTDLSQGQRKRLALLGAYLEDRPIYLFDEWAADQDPQFKEVFYLHLLPELKARGKTVLVISHDDQYYGVADRLVRVADGVIQYDGDPAGYTGGRLLADASEVALTA
ncbi:MAG TPA: cyclic peptide export ABC transporter [Longimicrobiaceae bacterium]|nr:cyclic peptide export ABC transporter [Longimicrobiaceae bacterium]